MADVIEKDTPKQYDDAVSKCRDLFLKKAKDYGTSWRILRPISLVEQIYIKAWRVRTLQEKKENKVGEAIVGEFIGMLNYAVIGLIQLGANKDLALDLTVEEVKDLYDKHVQTTKELMFKKNHDYGEAWRDMSQATYVDLILVKLLRMKQIISNDGQTIVSEGLDANYRDIINYSIFALIRIEEGEHTG